MSTDHLCSLLTPATHAHYNRLHSTWRARREIVCVQGAPCYAFRYASKRFKTKTHSKSNKRCSVSSCLALYLTPGSSKSIASSANDTNQHDHWCDRVGFQKSMFVNQTSIIYDVHRLIVRVEKMRERGRGFVRTLGLFFALFKHLIKLKE